MATAQDIQAVLEQKQTRLRQIEAPYLRQLEYNKGLENQQIRDRVLSEIAYLVAPLDGKDPNQAAFVAARIKQLIITQIQQPLDVIVEYEGLKREIETYYKTRA